LQISICGRASVRKSAARFAVVPIVLEERRADDGHAREIPGDDVTVIPARAGENEKNREEKVAAEQPTPIEPATRNETRQTFVLPCFLFFCR
jgi:hypothetical protein